MSDLMPGIQRTPSKQKAPWGLLVLVACFVVTGALVVIPIATKKPYDPNNEREAIAQCEAQVSDHLKSPTTARFSSTASGNGTWVVTGTVDSENSFGAVVRSSYQCTVVVNGPESITTKIDRLD